MGWRRRGSTRTTAVPTAHSAPCSSRAMQTACSARTAACAGSCIAWLRPHMASSSALSSGVTCFQTGMISRVTCNPLSTNAMQIVTAFSPGEPPAAPPCAGRVQRIRRTRAAGSCWRRTPTVAGPIFQPASPATGSRIRSPRSRRSHWHQACGTARAGAPASPRYGAVRANRCGTPAATACRCGPRPTPGTPYRFPEERLGARPVPAWACPPARPGWRRSKAGTLQGNRRRRWLQAEIGASWNGSLGSQFGFERDQVADLRGTQADHHRIAHVRQKTDVEDFGDVAFEADPVHHIPIGQRDDLHATPRIGIALAQFFVQLETLETLVARLGQADGGNIADDRQAAQEAGEERKRDEFLRREINPAQMAGAGVEHPELAVRPSRGMRHRQPFAHDLVGLDVDDHAAVVPSVAPAVDCIALADRGDVLRLSLDHRQPIEVAAIFGRQLADELRLPDRLEAVRLAQFCQARVLGVDEHHLAVAADAELVDVQVADRLRIARHVAAVELSVDDLIGAQDVLEPPQLVQATEIDSLRVADNAHRALEDALEEGHASLLVAAHQVHASGLVGRNGKRNAIAGEPAGEPARAGLFDLQPGGIRRLLRLRGRCSLCGSGCGAVGRYCV